MNHYSQIENIYVVKYVIILFFKQSILSVVVCVFFCKAYNQIF